MYNAVGDFRPYFSALASRGWRVIFYDGRGTGASQRDPVDFSLDARVNDLEAVSETVGADRFALCGNHSAGPAAIAYAVRHPDRVSHLILVNTFARGETYQESTPALRLTKDLRNIAEDQWEFYSMALANAMTSFSDGQ
jgi:pimeloyl-ACP methyl ester carboxylesterase